MEACEDSAATQECQPMSISGRVLIHPNVDLTSTPRPIVTDPSVASTSVQLALKTSETDIRATAASGVRPKAALKTLPTECSAMQICDTDARSCRDPIEGSLCSFGEPCLTHHRHFDFARIGQLCLKSLGNILTDSGCLFICGEITTDDHA